MSQKMHKIVRYATMAANSHNTQPWKFAIQSDGVDIYPDYSRRLPVVDPHDRSLWISLGCAIENLTLAANAMGYACNVAYPESEDYIHIRFRKDTARVDSLFNAIPHRQNTRSLYQGKAVSGAELAKLESVGLEGGIILYFIYHTF